MQCQPWFYVRLLAYALKSSRGKLMLRAQEMGQLEIPKQIRRGGKPWNISSPSCFRTLKRER